MDPARPLERLSERLSERLAIGMGAGGKHPGSSGFDSRQAQIPSSATRSGPQAGPSTSPLTHYCIVRRDLPRGVLAAQLIHAAGESVESPPPSGTRAIALAADDEAHLARVEAALLACGIVHCAIREPDPPWGGALMAIGLAPVWDRDRVASVTGGLRLLR